MMARIYRLLVGAAGLVLLGLSLTDLPSPQPWLTIATFVALSWAVKRAGFRVVGEVTHSLVNVVDVAILLLVGPLWGALVIVASNALALLAWDLRREHWTAPELLERAVFVGGIRALIALAAGNLYLALGGALAPTSFSGADLLPLGALFVTWFGLDHLLWTGHAFAQGGKPEARRFLEAAIGPSLLIELLPLPFALLFVVSWVLFDPALRLLLAGAVLGVALVIRLLARALRDSRERLRTVSMLSAFGEAVVRSELDELHLSALLFEYVSR
ncbi:MAG TPA: hypothetical protein VER55_02565, partial [Ardenticatenaceae bacterium]|nr:hypothetical protein [Ardenticatenaceae bacterium]